MNKQKKLSGKKVIRLNARVRTEEHASEHNSVELNSAVHFTTQKMPVTTSCHIPIPAHVRPAAQLPVTVRPTTFTRTNLPDGDFMMNYYYRRDKNGDLVPEDIERATHFERVVYDRSGTVLGSTTGELNDTVRW